MNVEFPIPDQLDQADFTRLVFFLEFSDEFDLTLEAFLRLRRGLMMAAKQMAGTEDETPVAEALFEPPLATDPVARRRFQRPAPSFVMRPPLESFGSIAPGAVVPLEILFMGDGLEQVPLFTQTIIHLGGQGLFMGKGHYQIVQIAGVNDSEQQQSLWQVGSPIDDLPLPVSNVKWWLERCAAPVELVSLNFFTPTRLLSNGRPLFDPTFGQLFPFILRRVTSMLYAHCGLEVVGDPVRLLEGANRITADNGDLRWEDWRTLSGRQDLGGILGRIDLTGSDLNELLWVLYLGALLQVGKGATYGAGYYTIEVDRV